MNRRVGLLGALIVAIIVALIVGYELSRPQPYVKMSRQEGEEGPTVLYGESIERFGDQRVLVGEPARYEVDETVTLHDVAFAPVRSDAGVWLVSLRVRNDDEVAREIRLPDNAWSGPRYEPVGDGLRISWLRGEVASSDPDTGEVSFSRGGTGADLVAVSRRQELVIEEEVVVMVLDQYHRFEVCLEVLPPSDPDSTAAWLRTGDRTIVDAEYEDGETVLLACGPATWGW